MVVNSEEGRNGVRQKWMRGRTESGTDRGNERARDEWCDGAVALACMIDDMVFSSILVCHV